MTVITIGERINGIVKVGFITIGAPKIIGSLILNRPGKKPIFPNSFKYADLDVKNKQTSAKVAPAPPIQTNHCKNISVKIFGMSVAAT